MARKASARKHIEPEDVSQGSPEEEGGTPVTKFGGSGGKSDPAVTKAMAIRHALAEGLIKYEDAGPFIKSRYGLDVTPGHFAASKSREKPAGEAARKPGRPKGTTIKVNAKRGPKPKAARQAVEGYLAPAPASKSGEGDIIETLEALKPLIAQHGAERLKRLVDVLG